MMNSNNQHDQVEATATAHHQHINSLPYYYAGVPQPVRLTTRITALDYNMEHKNRGYCVIFDIEKFSSSKNLPRRHGSQVDSTGLYNIFRSMSFDVCLYKNPTAKEIRYQLEDFASRDHSDKDCFVCCILTHGEHGQLWGTDSRFPVDMIFSSFLGDACATLVGKPKLFFIQACQGDKMDEGVNVIAQESLDSAASYFKIPTHADFLIAYSTLPGFYSWRNTQDGSWFMQALIRVLSDYHQDLDLLTMLTIVNHRVAYYKQSNANTPEFTNKKQVPCITSMLTRRVFLRPKKIMI